VVDYFLMSPEQASENLYYPGKEAFFQE
jgi:hypothetical protein